MDKDMITSASRDAVHEFYGCNGGESPCGRYGDCRFGTGCDSSHACMGCNAEDFQDGFIKGAEWAMSQQMEEQSCEK